MKKIMRKALGGALALAMSAGLLSGCGGGEIDPIQEAFGYSKDTVMMTVNGEDVTAEDLFFRMAQYTDYVASYYTQMGMEVDWTSDMGGEQAVGDYVKEQAKSTAVLYSVVEAQAKENGYTITDEDKADYEAELAQAKEDLGGEESYENWLKSMLITDSGMEKLSAVGILHNHMADGMFREGGEKAPAAEEMAQYVQENDLLMAKHILFMTQDLSEDEAAAKKTTAEDMVAQLKAISDPAELETAFDKLMNENSEDTGLENSPNGYVFTAGEMVEEFESATRALEIGQVSDLVESAYGYHIILRLDPAGSDEVQEEWAAAQMEALVQSWADEAEVVTTKDFEDLDVADFYEKLTAYRATFETEETAEEETQGTTQETTEKTPEEEAREAGQVVPSGESSDQQNNVQVVGEANGEAAE